MKSIIKKVICAVATASLLVCLAALPSTAEQTAEPVKAFVTISDKGELVMAHESVEVSDIDGDGSVTVNDALYAAHEKCFSGGAKNGYNSYESPYGLSLGTLWGDNSGAFGYCLDNASCLSLLDVVSEGSHVAAYVFSDSAGFSDSYSYFNVESKTLTVGEKLSLTLCASGYDEQWNPITLSVGGAAITVNGEATNAITDADGNAEISFDAAGRYVVSAVSDTAVLVPPVCVVTVEEAKSSSSALISALLSSCGASDVQEWIDGELAKTAGATAEWYVLALSRHGDYDFSKYEEALIRYIENNNVPSASTRLKYALTLVATGSDSKHISEIADNAIGEQGIMSLVFGLHLLNSGVTSEKFTEEALVGEILSLQLSDGGWAVSGKTGDVDVTAMTVQALAPHYDSNEAVKTAVDGAVELLSSLQNENGGFSSYGVENPESAAQVIIALSGIGVDAFNDSRFIKNGNSISDGILPYVLADGLISHTKGGEANVNATSQTLCAAVAFEMYQAAEGSFYDFTRVAPIQTAEPCSPEPNPSEPPTVNYKVIAVIAVVAVALLVCAVLFITKKATAKNLILAAVITLLCVLFILLTNFQSADDFYSGNNDGGEDVIGSVTLSITCEDVRENGSVLAATAFSLNEGDTVYDVLLKAVQKNRIHLETSGAASAVYVEGIDNVYELEHGELSGWLYYVNGESPQMSCGACTVKDGDVIEWIYSTDMGSSLALAN